MSSDKKNGSFDDLEEMDHKDIDEMKGDLELEIAFHLILSLIHI